MWYINLLVLCTKLILTLSTVSSLTLGLPLFLPCLTEHPVSTKLLWNLYTECLLGGFLPKPVWKFPWPFELQTVVNTVTGFKKCEATHLSWRFCYIVWNVVGWGPITSSEVFVMYLSCSRQNFCLILNYLDRHLTCSPSTEAEPTRNIILLFCLPFSEVSQHTTTLMLG